MWKCGTFYCKDGSGKDATGLRYCFYKHICHKYTQAEGADKKFEEAVSEWSDLWMESEAS